MAPEQALGETALMDARTDVYGLGATLYAVLSGHSPFPGPTTWTVLRRVVEEDPQSPGGDRDLETICLTAMAKDRGHRYQSAYEFAEELTRYLERRPVLARRAGMAYRMRRSIQRRPAIWGLTAALAVAVACGAAFGLSQLIASRASLLKAEASLTLAHEADTARLAAAAVREGELRLENLVARSRRELDALDDTLSRQLSSAQRQEAYAQVDALLQRLRDEQRVQPDEGILDALAGQAELLHNHEASAITAFETAIAHADSPVSRELGTLASASQGHALARLRHDYFDQMANLEIFDDESGYIVGDRALSLLKADLERSGQGIDSYAQQCLELWVRYITAASSTRAAALFVAIGQDAATLAAQGGRHQEIVLLLSGILEPFPRALETVVARYSAGIDLCHNLPQLYVQRGLEYYADDRMDAALANCDQALALNPDYALAHLMRAKALLASQGLGSIASFTAAMPDVTAAIRLAPLQPNGPLTRAQMLWRAGRFREASDDFDMAQRLAGDIGAAYRHRAALWSAIGEFHRQLGRTVLALTDFENAASFGNRQARQTAAGLLEEDGRFNTAQELLSGLLRDGTPSPSDARDCCTARLWRAGVRERRGDIPGALADYDWVIAQVPNFLPALSGRGDVLTRAGRSAEALPLLDHAVLVMRDWVDRARAGGMPGAQADRHMADVLVSRAAAEAALPGREAAALADCQQALGINPVQIDGLVLRAALTRHAGLGDGVSDAVAAATLLLDQGDAQRARYEFTDALATYAKAAAIHADERSRRALEGTQAERSQAASQAGGP